MYHEPEEHRHLRTLAVECMRGGHIIVAAPATLNTAESLGAVRVFMHSLDETCTIPPILPYEERESVSEMLLASTTDVPDVFVVRDAATPVDGLPSFVRLNSIHDLEPALLHRPYLLLASNHILARQLKALLSTSHSHIPVYAEVESMDDALEAYSITAAVDGLLMHGTPSVPDMHHLYRRQAAAIPLLEPNDAYTIGVLAHQGDYQLHIAALQALTPKNMRICPVGTPDAIDQVNALLLPGGWSTVQGAMMQVTNVDTAVRECHDSTPILAVCAGLILARQRDGQACDNRIHLDLLPVTIDNNQLNGVYDVTGHDGKKVFSNGPVVRPLHDSTTCDSERWGPDVCVVSRIAAGDHRGKVVAVRSGNRFGFAFHEGIHATFLEHCLRCA